jgi:hypothetical protein
MLDLVGAIVEMATAGVILVAVTQFVPGTLATRLGLGGIAGGWVGLAQHLGATGRLAFAPDHPVPLVAVLCTAPLLAVGVLAFTSARVRAVLLAIPMPVLIGLNTLRLLGVLFLMLAVSGRLSGPFPYSAGLGDMITGAFALPLALSVARSGSWSLAAVARWNAFGTLDLVAALAFGLTSAAGSPLQLFHIGAGSEAMQYLPFALVPTVLVPFYLITHGIVAAQLRALRAAPALSHAGCVAVEGYHGRRVLL